jgi:hypothetical protein
VGTVAGLPSVTMVVTKVVVDVLGATIVVSTTVKKVDVAVTVLSAVDVSVEPFRLIVTTSAVTDKRVETVWSGKLATVDWVTMLSIVVVGTGMVCVVVGAGSSVVLVNGA